jgi:2OG-Fe(II) oxygenase superfamily
MMQSRAPFFFVRRTLLPIAEANRVAFAAATPFPHLVVDNLLPDDVLDRAVTEFPPPCAQSWIRRDDTRSRKLEINDESILGPTCRQLMCQLNSATFIDFLECLTGIEGLIPDPHHLGGGIQQVDRDGFLKVHTDVTNHKVSNLDRRLNVLLYLNRDWDASWGGQFELWNGDMSWHKSVDPSFNRMVIFATHAAKHGHPDPLRCPEDTARRTMVLHYYSNGRPGSERASKDGVRHFERFGETFLARSDATYDCRVPRTWAKEVLPPIALRVVKRLRERHSEEMRVSRRLL